MKGYNREPFFWVGVVLLCLVHVDFWAWEKIQPLLWGWIPYHLWFEGILTLAGSAFFLWWGKKGWPNPPADLER